MSSSSSSLINQQRRGALTPWIRNVYSFALLLSAAR